MDPRYRTALARLFELRPIRPIDEWVPRGKGRETLFRSLASHWLAKFPVPAVVWNAFLDGGPASLVNLAAHVAGGGSLYDFVKASFPIPLTRKMCHELLATPADYKLLDAIRRVQSRAAGCDARFFDAWRTTRYAQHIGTKEDEEFWATTLLWFSNVPMLEASQVAPLYDYISHRRREDERFSMKGRSGPAMIRAMNDWHGTVVKTQHLTARFPASGLSEADFNDSRRDPKGNHIKEVWRFRELLTAKSLAEEGSRMGHCVFSYAWRIEKGDTSIWSVQMEDGQGETGNWHMVTLEVRNDLRRVVQAKGRFNRSMSPTEVRIVRRWAGLNNLAMTGIE
jgi:hypothetical protein